MSELGYLLAAHCCVEQSVSGGLGEMQGLARLLIALHFRKLQLWFSGFSTVVVSLSGGKDSNLERRAMG